MGGVLAVIWQSFLVLAFEAVVICLVPSQRNLCEVFTIGVHSTPYRWRVGLIWRWFAVMSNRKMSLLKEKASRGNG
jgi:hypothetical protein